jgi:hypothetical protein
MSVSEPCLVIHLGVRHLQQVINPFVDAVNQQVVIAGQCKTERGEGHVEGHLEEARGKAQRAVGGVAVTVVLDEDAPGLGQEALQPVEDAEGNVDYQEDVGE